MLTISTNYDTTWKRRPPNGSALPLLTAKCLKLPYMHCRSLQKDSLSDDIPWLKFSAPHSVDGYRLDTSARELTLVVQHLDKMTGNSSLLFSAKFKLENVHYRSLLSTLLHYQHRHVSDHNLAPRSASPDEQHTVEFNTRHEQLQQVQTEHNNYRNDQPISYPLTQCTPTITTHDVRVFLSVQVVCNMYCIFSCIYLQAALKMLLCAHHVLEAIQNRNHQIVDQHSYEHDQVKFTKHHTILQDGLDSDSICPPRSYTYHVVAAVIVILRTKFLRVSKLLLTPTSKISETVGARKKPPSGRSIATPSSLAQRDEVGAPLDQVSGRNLVMLYDEHLRGDTSGSRPAYTSTNTRLPYTLDVKYTCPTLCRYVVLSQGALVLPTCTESQERLFSACMVYHHDTGAVCLLLLPLGCHGNSQRGYQFTVIYLEVTQCIMKTIVSFDPVQVRVVALKAKQLANLVSPGQLTSAPSDAEAGSNSGGKQSTHQSTFSRNITTRASARRALSRNNSTSSSNNGDDGGEDKHPVKPVLLASQCENSANPATEPEAASQDGTILGRISRQLLDTFTNMTLFTSHVGETVPGVTPESPFSLNISDTHQTPKVGSCGENSEWPTPIILLTPSQKVRQVSDEESDTGDDQDGYFTTRGDPEITPVRSTRSNVLLSPYDPRFSKPRARTRSVGDSRPYPPAEIVKKKLRLKIDSQLFGGTPARKRSPSESDINFSESLEIPRHEFTCVQIREEGYHDCSTGRKFLLHLKHDFLQGKSEAIRTAIVSSLEKALKKGTSPDTESEASKNNLGELKQKCSVCWEQVTVKTATERLKSGTSNINDDMVSDPLLHLLAKLNTHYSEVATDKPIPLFNSLTIETAVGRDMKIPLNDAVRSARTEPLVILHLGKHRAVNVIPKKLNLAMLDVFDVRIDNFTVMTVFPKTRESMAISLPREKALEDDDLDLHILVYAYHSDRTLKNELEIAGTAQDEEELSGSLKDESEPDRPRDDDDQLEPGGIGEEEMKVAGTVEDGLESVRDVMYEMEPGGNSQGAVEPCGADKDVMESGGCGEDEREPGRSNEDDSVLQTGADGDGMEPEGVDICEKESVRSEVRKVELGGTLEDEVKPVMAEKVSMSPIGTVKEVEIPVVDKSESKINGNSPKSRKDKRFLSSTLCAGIVNGNNKDFVKKCLHICGLQLREDDKADENRAVILEFIQSVKQGKTTAPKPFIYIMVGKLSNEGVESELLRMKIQAEGVKKAKDRKQLVKNYLLEVHHGRENRTPVHRVASIKSSQAKSSHAKLKTDDRPINKGTAARQPKKGKKVNGSTLAVPPPLLLEDAIDSSSGAECWSDIETVQDEEDQQKQKNGFKHPTLRKKRCSVAVRNSTHSITKRGIINNKRKSTFKQTKKHDSGAHTAGRKSDDIQKLETALSILQGKLIDQIEDNKKLQQSLTDALIKERERCDKLEKEIIAQKSCIDLILQESTTKSKTNLETVQRAVSDESKVIKSEIKSLKTDLPILMTRSEENCLAKVKMEIETLQSAVDSARDKNSHKIKETSHRQSLIMRRVEAIEKQISSKNAIITPNTAKDSGSVTEVNTTGEVRENKMQNTPKGHENKTYAAAVETGMTPDSKGRDTYRIGGDKHRDQQNRRVPVEKGNNRNRKDAREPPESPREKRRSFSKKKCLLIHDSTFENFDQAKFPNQFDIVCFHAKKASIAAKSKQLKDLIKDKKPECIYVHLGLHDIISCSVDSTLCSFEALRDYLLSSTEANICFSSIVPTANNPTLNRKINEFNKELNLMVTTARSDNETLKEQLFTYNNSSVAWLNEMQQDGVHLTERGKLVMWTKLKDGLRKTLRLPRPYLKSFKSPSSSPENSQQNE